MKKVFKTSKNYEISLDKKHLTISKDGEEQSKTFKEKYFNIMARGVERRKNKLLPLLVGFAIITLFAFIEAYITWDYKNYPSYTVSYLCLFITTVVLVLFLRSKSEIDEENKMYSENEPELKLFYNEGDGIAFHIVKGTIDEIKELEGLIRV